MRRPILAGNWKMNLLRADAETYCRRLVEGLGREAAAEILVFPPFPLLSLVAVGLDGAPVACGGQDVHFEDAGAHTGDTSASQLVDAGCSWALCGHSERRQDHGETDDVVAAKVRAALRHGLSAMLCVGESERERADGLTQSVLSRQLEAAMPPPEAGWALAYEPIWAIGTGQTATPETAQEAHAFLRRQVARAAGEEAGASLRILYGGSVKPENCVALLEQPDIDGFLIGGASLDPRSFLDIIRRCGSVRSPG